MKSIGLLDHLPCSALVTDGNGLLQEINAEMLRLIGGQNARRSALIRDLPMQADLFEVEDKAGPWRQRSIDDLVLPASRIFLQTHVWPLLLRDGQVREIQLQLRDADGLTVPVLVNCSRREVDGVLGYWWVFFVAKERSLFEAAVLASRRSAEASEQALVEKEHFTRQVTDAMPGLVAYWGKDLICRFANYRYLDWFGKSSQEAVGMSYRDLLGERLFTMNLPHAQAALAGKAQCFEGELIDARGVRVATLAHYMPDFEAEGSVSGFFVHIGDVTPLKDAEIELKLAAGVFDHAADAIVVTDSDYCILRVNPAFVEITGYSAAEAVGMNLVKLKSTLTEDNIPYSGVMEEVAAKGQWSGDRWSRRKNGEVYLQAMSVTAIQGLLGQALRYITIFSDATERWNKDEEIRQQAFHDALTGLPNRHLLLERLGQLITMTEREQRQVALLFLDLDRFKAVNDEFGHAAGDQLLKLVAARLQAQVRTADTVARLGGDEFVVLLDNPANVDEVARIAQRIVDAVSAPIQLAGQTLAVGASVGVALHPAHGQTPAELMHAADRAMYAAKQGGSARTVFAGRH
jgi:diguanylate cyclase (GGDEF)-like protein/PAS domain S-box-containing protein